MLTRRHIRIKVLHALYGFEQRSDKDLAKSLKDLKQDLDSIFDLYLYELKGLLQFLYAAQDRIETNRNKHLASREDLKPNMRFVNNRVFQFLENNEALNNLFESRRIKWGEHRDSFKKLYRELMTTEEYRRYMEGHDSFANDKKIIKFIYGRFMVSNESLHSIYEDMNIHWADDLDAAQMMTVKTLKVMMEVNGTIASKVNFAPEVLTKIEKSKKLPSNFIPENQELTVQLFKDKSDKEFGPKLFSKAVNRTSEFEEKISDKTSNWEADRIAMLDRVLMKLALTELTEFPDIPVKVTLNEYIELSKMYSTPKSSQFVNGVLDKITAEYKKIGEIKKIGRGLL